MTNGRASHCYFCDETDVLERHHIVPQRFDGADSEENIVTVCPTCHQKLEQLYDKRFYENVGADRPTGGEENTETESLKIVDTTDFLRLIGECIRKHEQNKIAEYAVCVKSAGIVKLRIRLPVVYRHVQNHHEDVEGEKLLNITKYRTSLKEDLAYVTETSIATRFKSGEQLRAVGFDVNHLQKYFSDFPLEQIPGFEQYCLTA